MTTLHALLSTIPGQVGQDRRVVDKPWGYEEIFALVPGKFCGKILHLREGHALSLHYHRIKEEVIAVQAGRATVEIGPSVDDLRGLDLGPGDAVHVPPCVLHRITGVTAVVLLEVSTPELDDVFRVSDRYGREGDGVTS